MNKVKLKRGRGTIDLIKSEDLIAVKPTLENDTSNVLEFAGTESTVINSENSIAGFQIVKVKDVTSKIEDTLNKIRSHHGVDEGTLVFHTPNSSAPIVPTGRITMRFNPESSDDQRQAVLDEYSLEIVRSKVKEKSDGRKIETYIVKTTKDSLNPLEIAEKLQDADDIITLIEPDLATPGKLFSFQLPTDSLLKEQWHLQNTGSQFGTSLGLKQGADARVTEAWQRAKSLGSPTCVVAVIDDGFDLTHPDLAANGKVVAPWDFTSNSKDPSPKTSRDKHGTACAGVAIGNSGGGAIVGSAPNCRFMPVRWGEYISDDTIQDWFGYVEDQGAWVVSCSWGVDADEFILSTLMDEAISECATEGRNGLGCVVVFASGNDNHDISDLAGGTYDGFATHPDVIAVAACNSRDEKSNYSNFGSEISICAPSSGKGGRGILTADVRGTYQYQGNTYYAGYASGDYTENFGGTSSATPLVAGICGLLLSVDPTLTSKKVKEIIESTARQIGKASDYDTNGHSIYYGYGCINADAAVEKITQQLDSSCCSKEKY